MEIIPEKAFPGFGLDFTKGFLAIVKCGSSTQRVPLDQVRAAAIEKGELRGQKLVTFLLGAVLGASALFGVEFVDQQLRLRLLGFDRLLGHLSRALPLTVPSARRYGAGPRTGPGGAGPRPRFHHADLHE